MLVTLIFSLSPSSLTISFCLEFKGPISISDFVENILIIPLLSPIYIKSSFATKHVIFVVDLFFEKVFSVFNI